MADTGFREIPYNYTSFSDEDIILKYFDKETWDIINNLRSKRVTGRSAKLIFEIMGDIFVIDRNPYIFNDFLEHPRKIRALYRQHKTKLNIIESTADGLSDVVLLVSKARDVDRRFFKTFHEAKRDRLKILHGFHSATAVENIRFSALDKVSHVTDASDWRVEYPQVVVYPDSVEEVPDIIKAAQYLGLKIIPFGGGTGTTGGVAPVFRNTAVVNTEKLNRIGRIETVLADGKSIPVIEAEAGVITDHVINYCKSMGYVFATDPTSSWASTIGGNIAEDAGGKKCVMWGTAIDNIYSFRIVNAAAECLEVRRKNHPYRKIQPTDVVTFDVVRIVKEDGDEKEEFLRSISLKASEIRKSGVGKDVTNKALGGVPGLHKEGGDGIIISAKFVLYKPFKFCETICLEFFGSNLVKASKAIVDILAAFDKNEKTYLTALEHLDDKYAVAINYRNKSRRSEIPKAVIIIDAESDDEKDLAKACGQLLTIVKRYDAEGFIAGDTAKRTAFWNERKHLGAIAKHTNAFKLNEDIVIPIESLPQFSDFVEMINIQKELENYVSIIDKVKAYFDGNPLAKENSFVKQKVADFMGTLSDIRKDFVKYAANINKPAASVKGGASKLKGAGKVFEAVRDAGILKTLEAQVRDNFARLFYGYSGILADVREIFTFGRTRKIIVATHMHAGDGNIHVNLPVHSGDPAMMHEAHEVVAKVMKETVALGGVISGEHGIGLTKLKFTDKKILADYAAYKRDADPEDLFNPGKLTADFKHNMIYTPSFNLMGKEAFVLEASDLGKLSASVASCVRCGKCKDVCNTHYPKGNMFFSPRNKIFGISLITEAVLYEALTEADSGLQSFAMLKDIANHCTGCHKCEVPCSVDIDFGSVNIAIKELLAERNAAGKKRVTAAALTFLKQKGTKANHFLRLLYFRIGYRLQRLGYVLNKPFKGLTSIASPFLSSMLAAPLPANAGTKTLREFFSLKGNDSFFAFCNPEVKTPQSVIYFPGCGSERTFPDISLAVIALLYNAGYRIVIAPEYLCCGYPFLHNGDAKAAKDKSYENRVIFHRMADTIGYMNAAHVVVSCGTCMEMLGKYGLGDIFQGATLIDCAELIAKNKLYPQTENNRTALYHDPCHSPLKTLGPDKTFSALFGAKPRLVANCCGEGGTLALSTPNISGDLRSRKRENIEGVVGSKAEVTVLTTCPSCVQGLSKITGNLKVTGKHLAVQLAEDCLGADWKKNFIKTVKKQNGIEKIIL